MAPKTNRKRKPSQPSVRGFLPKPAKAKKHCAWRPYDRLEMTVVDEHNNAMLPVWKAMRANRMPKKGLKFLHFDSHPDLGCIEAEDDHDLNVLSKVYSGSYNRMDLHDFSCIGTFILPMVLEGIIDEVTWCAGHWCHQLGAGSYDLLVGISKEDGRMKVASASARRPAILDYWKSDGADCKKEEFAVYRPWKLHVFKFSKNGPMSAKNRAKIVSNFQKGEWILDIDEDYLSCNNPHGIEFRANFGDESYDILRDIYDADVQEYYEYWKGLEKIVLEGKFKLSSDAFHNDETVRIVLDLLKTAMSAKEAKLTLDKFQSVCVTVFPRKVDKSKWNAEDYYEHKDIIETGEMTCVPHHVSTLPHILKMLNSTVEIFEAIPKKPVLITVATSRCDRYLPDAQASLINTLVLRMLRRQFGNVKTIRKDIPEHSAEDVEPQEYQVKPAKLYAKKRGKNGKRKPVSR